MSGLVLLLGHHIGYSASPAVQNAAFAALSLPLRYALRDVPPGALGDAVSELRRLRFAGANVTQPHKVAICERVDELAPEVRRLGAANTIVRREGRLVAHNTDLGALVAEMAEMLAAIEARTARAQRAVVLGAGGASRAARAALADSGVPQVEIVDRARWEDLPHVLATADLVVNATPVGTASDESPIPRELLRPGLAVFDLVYRPSPSALVREARATGALARGGAGMLLRQAAASLALWTGRVPPLDAMRTALRAELGPGAEV